METPIFISGRVTLPDGSEPPEHVLIERVCGANQVRSEGYTDSHGRFSIQLGQSLQVIPDAAQSMLTDGTQGFARNTAPGAATDPYVACELRARLAGYRSSTLLLAGRRPMDNPDIGTLILFPMSSIEGSAVSATAASASKEARKAFEKGLSEARKRKFDAAERELRRAVELHPKYADAWLELGKTLFARKRLPEARQALEQAIAADARYVYPYDVLYQVVFEQSDWQALADTTERLLRLNPYEFPAAYYYNGVANLQLRNLDAAEKSLRKALETDRRHSNPKTYYVMGLVLAQKRDYAGAADSLMAFAELAPNDPQIPKVRQLLEELAKAIR
jgi:tetratricopeptide (TPR) repeat protein